MSDGAPRAGPTSELVGREPERARIEGFLSSISGGPSALTVIGEAGIGKSALWRYAIARSRSLGYRVLVSRPAEEEMPLPGVGLTDLFEHVDADSPATPDDLFASGRATLGMLRDLAEEGPVVVAIDDAQWLDSFSLRSLRYAMRRLQTEPVAVLATRRREADGEDPLEIATAVVPERVHEVAPGPLGLEDIRRVIGASVATISRPTLRRITDASAGNPLYALELARTLRPGEDSDSAAEPLPMPDSIQAVIGERIESRAEELGPLLEVLAAMGRATVGELRELLPDGDADRLLSLAQSENLIVVDDALSARFSHPLIGSLVYARIDPIARHSLHSRLAELADDPDVRARHLARSVDGVDPRVAGLLEDAATRANQRGAPDLAAEFLANSLRLTPADDVRSERRRSLQRIADLAASGRAGHALELADGLLATLPAGPDRAAVLVQRFKVEDDDLAFGERLLLEALDGAGTDEGLRGRVLDMLAWLYGMLLGNLEDGVRCAREGIAIAERTGDEPLRMLTMSSLALMEALAGNPSVELLDEAVAIERDLGGQGTNEGPLGLLGKIRFWSGDLPAARALFEEALRAAAREGNELTRPYRLYDLSLLECASGNLAEARELARLGIEAAEDARFPLGSLHYPNALVAAWQGNAEDARRSAELLEAWARPRGERPAVVRALMVTGLIALSEANAGHAVGPLTEAVSILDDMGIGEPGAFPVLPDAIEALARTGDLDRADVLLAQLESQTEKVDNSWARSAVDRSRGVLLGAKGEPDEAVAVLQRAESSFDRLGFRPEAARAALLRGQALLRGGHRTAAADALVDARDRFASIGAAAWEARALEELERSAPGRATGALTTTERRIAGLVAEGKKNREIAEAMFVSVATIEAHLTRMYRKLDIRTRSELTALVAGGSLSVAESAD